MNIDNIAKSLGFMVKRTCENNAFYYLVDEKGFDKRNTKGEKLCVEIGVSRNAGKSKHSLPRIWFEKGYTKELITEWWSVQTYITDKDGNCFRAYDPTIKKSEDGKRIVINFDWHLPTTDENFRKLLVEILRQFNA